MSGELVETHLTEDHKQFWNSLKVGDDNLDSRSNSQNEPEQDLVKGQLCFVMSRRSQRWYLLWS